MAMNNYSADSADIARILTDAYFKGIYEGDVNLLGSTFYSGTLLFGDAGGKPFKGEILSIEIINSIAVAKVHVKMYEFNYFELLSFHKPDGKWVIVNKMISDVGQ